MASTSTKRLEGKVALVTGGASGIGESIVKVFVANGAKVVIGDIQDDLGQSLSKQLGEEKASAAYVHCDVTNETDVENIVNKAVTLFGKLDIMVCNAGITGPFVTNILDTDKSDFERVIGTNLIGPFLCTKHAARVMIPNRSGVIIYTGSSATSIGGVAPYGYIASKHGLVGLMVTAAVELGEHGIRVNCVSPGPVLTPLLRSTFQTDNEGCREIFAVKKMAVLSPEDVARAMVFVASEDSMFMNGHNLIFDGGFTIENRAFNVYHEKAILSGE